MDSLPEGYVQCPHEKSHIILETRIQVHLVKCNRNHAKSGKMICPYNTTHVVEKSLFEKHVKECPNGNSLALHKNIIDSTSGANRSLTSSKVEQLSEQTVNISTGEDWSDSNVPTYNAKAHCINNGLLMNMIGGTRSERKAFREAQDERFIKKQKK